MEAVCFNSLLGSLFRQCASDHEPRSSPVLHRANVAVAKANECLGLARGEHKLDFKTVWRVKVDDSAEITTTETVLR